VKVMAVDLARKRIALSIKALQPAPAQPQSQPQQSRAPFNAPRRRN
jgi:ribosomal protein S1